jgi:hypothetical protein
MKTLPSRRLFLRNYAITTTGISLISSTSILNSFAKEESPFDGNNPYVFEKLDLRSSTLI